MVTFLRGFGDGVPMGECELYRMCRCVVAPAGPSSSGRMAPAAEGRALRSKEEAHDRSRGVAARDMVVVVVLTACDATCIHWGQGGTRIIGGGNDGGQFN